MDDLEAALEEQPPLAVYFIHVDCELAELERRESSRGDRVLGTSRWSSEHGGALRHRKRCAARRNRRLDHGLTGWLLRQVSPEPGFGFPVDRPDGGRGGARDAELEDQRLRPPAAQTKLCSTPPASVSYTHLTLPTKA